MNRRGFFGALLGGAVAATGLRSLISFPATRLGARLTGRTWVAGDVILLKSSAVDGAGHVLQIVDPAVTLPGTAPWRAAPATQFSPALPAALDVDATAPAAATLSAVTVVDLPEVWPGPHSAITATAALPPLDQVETLIELFGASGDAAPSFAAALIGELVLTRMRLADLQRLHAPAGLAS